MAWRRRASSAVLNTRETSSSVRSSAAPGEAEKSDASGSARDVPGDASAATDLRANDAPGFGFGLGFAGAGVMFAEAPGAPPP
eukprot:30881-Pelagococcus_subviridis.AAC.9